MAKTEVAAQAPTPSVPADLANLNLIELLEKLEPVPAPEPISLFPQTPFWGWLALLLLIGVAYVSYRGWRKWRARAYRRAALAEIAQAGDDPIKLARILRRTALCAFPRREVASLHGEQWLAFLNEHYPGNKFAGEIGQTLDNAPYQPNTNSGSAPGLAKLVAEWVRTHKVPTTGENS